MLRKLGYECQISDNFKIIEMADKIILPGVGSFDHGVEQLKQLGLWQLLIKKAHNKIPFLGICLGAQLMGTGSEEGDKEGLGLFDMHNIRFEINKLNKHHKIPHMGWGNIDLLKDSKIISNQTEDHRYYFVHSYHFTTNDESIISAMCRYSYNFPCALEKDNIFALQFHPEKSHKYGMDILRKFADL